jgi:hypothetical protein
MLDWYFDCDDEQHSLRESLKRSSASQVKGKAQAGGGAQAAPPHKLERIGKHKQPDETESSCYVLFRRLLNDFRETLSELSEKYCGEDQCGPEAFHESMIWIRKDKYALDACPSDRNPQEHRHNVWLGLGRLEGGIRKPAAFKKNDETPEQKAKLAQIMRKLKPGSFIASAEFVKVEALECDPEAPQREQTPRRQKRWVSEAGVCTLEQLFGRHLTASDIIERNTKAHRMLVREILHSMALAVFHLHECRIAHTSINLRYFKVFLIEEPPRSTNLRVKLVSMRKADNLTPIREREDIEDLGHAMARLVLGENPNVEELLSYDPSLYWLVKWILDDSNSPTLADVIRHPYFMSLNEKEVFTFALEGGVFGEILTTAEVTPPTPLPLPTPAALHRMLSHQPRHLMFLFVLP